MKLENITIAEAKDKLAEYEELKKLFNIKDDQSCCSENVTSFLNVGEQYLFRTVTMIYSGKIVAMNKNEIALEQCCWIAETKRWYDSLKECDFNEVEPYVYPVVLFKGAILDVTKLDKLPTEQK